MGTTYKFICREHGAERDLGKGDNVAWARLIAVAPTIRSLLGDDHEAAFGYSGGAPLEWLVSHGSCPIVLRDCYGYTYDQHGDRVECEDQKCHHPRADHGEKFCRAKSKPTESPCGCTGWKG